MKVFWGALVLSAVLTASAAATQVEVGLIESFRTRAQLPPLSPIELSRLATRPDGLQTVKIEAAQAFLAGINPHFDATITAESRFLDSPELTAIKRDVAAARQVLVEAKLEPVRQSLLVDGKVDADNLDAVFNGSKTLARRAQQLPGSSSAKLSELILDGAPRHALEALDRLAKFLPRAKKIENRDLIEGLRRALKLQRPSSPVAEFERRLAEAAALLRKGEYGAAMLAARELSFAVMATPARELTRQALYIEAAVVEQRARENGAYALYGTGGRENAKSLAERVAKLPYKGSPLRPEPTRCQNHGDCAVQQAFNHPKVAAAADVISYGVFLDGVTGLLDSAVRKEGMHEGDTNSVLRQLGLKAVYRRAPDEAGLLEALDAHGALMTTIRWTPEKNGRIDRRGNHAVIVQGSFLEDGVWRFVLIDSNHARPQVFSYEDLLVFGATRLESVEPLAEGELPLELKGLPDVESRVRVGARIIAEKWAPIGRSRAWWRRLLSSLGLGGGA